MNILDLHKVGLTGGEIKVYNALLELGETTRTELAQKSGISPSKIYDVCNRLVEKGLINSVKKNGIIHFSVASPNRIKDFIEQKEEEIKNEKEILNNMLPDLLLKYNKTKDKTDIEVFYGWEGMKTIYSEISESLSKRDENLIFGASMGRDHKKADQFFSHYYTKVEKKKYNIKIIFNDEVRGHVERTNYFVKSKIHEVRYLHQNTFTELNVYKNTVLIIMLLEKPIIIRIKNKDACDSFRKFFDTMWKIAKS